MASGPDLLSRGMGLFKGVTQKTADMIRAGDEALGNIDSALSPSDMTPAESSEASLMKVVAMMKSVAEEARFAGDARSPQVINRSKEILRSAAGAGSAWRGGPAGVKTATDMVRLAVRDLRSSHNLIKLASGNGSLDDIDAVVEWIDQLTDRVNNISKVVTQPKSQAKPAETGTIRESIKTQVNSKSKIEDCPACTDLADQVKEHMARKKVIRSLDGLKKGEGDKDSQLQIIRGYIEGDDI